jgi:pyruvate/2-oxoglutarate dehydrogenase complex dihydrolipoamide acyltransferase (E2) component
VILRMTVPTGDAAFRAGFIAKWFKNEGDPIGFGEDLCDVAIDEFVAMQRTKRATVLGSISKARRRKMIDRIDLREGRGQVTIRLVSGESGMRLGKVLVAEGERIEIGTLIAVLTSGDDAGLAGDVERAAEARIAVNMPDAEEIDPFD